MGQDVFIPPVTELTDNGKIVDLHIRELASHYKNIEIPKYVVMPNHIHILMNIESAGSGDLRTARPTLQSVVRSFKTFTTREIGFSTWQDSFYEHIVRNEEDYLRIWKYIDENPAKWNEDKFYKE